jgi:hypothetical protein
MAIWQRILVTVLVGASCAYACKIEKSDDEDDDSIFDDDDDDEPQAGTSARAGSAGSAGTGGRGGSAGSATSGGKPGTAGTAGRGGTTGSGGSSAGTAGTDDLLTDLECDGRQGKTPDSTCEFTEADDRYKGCLSCLSNSCCSELKQCYATNPADACGYGGPDNGTEYACYIECLVKAAKDSGFNAYDPDEDPMRCALDCGTPKDGMGKTCPSPLIADSTNALLSCMHTNCEPECIDELVDK